MPVQSTTNNKLYHRVLQQEKFKKISKIYIKICNFTCPGFCKFANIKPEMKKILLFICAFLFCTTGADCAVRNEKTVSRASRTDSARTARTTRSVSSRTPLRTNVSPRAVKPVTVLMPKTSSKTTTTRTAVRQTTPIRKVSARTTSTANSTSETRTGAAYDQCKSAFFTCMDQFCGLKDDSFRRCSCSDRVFDFQEIIKNYQDVGAQLSEFSENLDVVGLSYEEAIAMKTASEGEEALAKDKTASKQLLQAIMNSIKGEKATVSGKYQDLNSIVISSDMSYAFDIDDSAQLVASYNGTTLYKAVYPKCRNAVKEDCNNASLQRAVNAYLMAIEQDCNTVETALQKQQKTLKTTTHESSAMLDLARVENRQKHNSDDVATCLANVEDAILNEEVCGSNYHKCLDYGQFIDVTTGAPLTGVSDFYKLGELLTFRDDSDLKDQKLSTISNNRKFVQFFENKTKKFAEDSLDKCVEDSDYVWQQYLDKALLDIYYAQQDKVNTIKQSCLDLVANCYENQTAAIASAMANLTGDSTLLLKPTALSLTTEMCQNYIDSCNGMFNEDIIQAYIDNKQETDSLSACRAVAQQCFDSFGGTGYNNFYYTQSGLFAPGKAMTWFTLYGTDENNQRIIVSPCAQQVANTQGCEDKLEIIFGGFDEGIGGSQYLVEQRNPRNKGIATEVYYQIMDSLSNHCAGLKGYFVEYKNAVKYGYNPDDFCKIDSNNMESVFYINQYHNSPNSLTYWYHFIPEENMCPLNYRTEVDTQSWGMCSCWENGGYRSKDGTIETCGPLLPALYGDDNPLCSADILCPKNDDPNHDICTQPRFSNYISHWCQQSVQSSDGKLCPTTNIITQDNNNTIYCADNQENPQRIDAVDDVPKHTKDTY